MKCSNCGGTMRYDVASFGLVCDFCGHTKPLRRPEEQYVSEERDFESALRENTASWGTARRLITCKQCGAAMLYDSDQMSGMCPYCGSTIVLTAGEMDNSIAPSGIIPFTTTREQVAQNYYKWNKFALWSPERFRKGKVLGNLVGVYVPFWTFDADTVSTYTGDYGDNVTVGDSTTTKWHTGRGVIDKFVNDMCICGSRRFCSNKMLNSVVMFRPDEILPYTPEALAGFAAEKYTINIDEAWEMAKNSIRGNLECASCQNEHADYYRNVKLSTQYSNIKFRYILFPVWLAACPYNGKIYYVVASGHDNRGNCGRPVSVLKIILLVLIVLGIFATPYILYMIMVLVRLLG